MSATVLHLPYPPSEDAYWRFSRGRMRRTYTAHDYRKVVADSVSAAGLTASDKPICVTVCLWRPTAATAVCDAVPMLLDSLTGIAFQNRAQIVRMAVVSADVVETPCVQVCIKPAWVTAVASPSATAPDKGGGDGG